jgi:pilus assembly protein CpaF
MRPDRIIVGEVRGGEALDMLQAMNTGHEGSLSTAHANSPRDLLSRLETMALMSDVELPVAHVREQIAGALDLIVHVMRLPDGRRCVSRVAAVEGLVAGSVVVQDVFRWRRGPIPGFETTGTMPRVAKLLAERDERVDPRIFGELAAPAARVSERSDSAKPLLRRPARAPRAEGRWQWPGRVRRLGTILE